MRWIIRIVGAFVVLLVLAVVFVMLIPTERVAQMAADQFEKATGRQLRFEGEVSPRFWPVLGIKTGPVSISNADWSKTEGPMFSAESLLVGVSLSSLYGGDIHIEGIEAVAPKVLLERAKDGRVNWDFAKAEAQVAGEAGETSAPAAQRSYSLAKGGITGGTLRYLDHAAGQDITFDAVDAQVAVPDYAGPFSMNMSAVLRGAPVRVKLDGGAFSALVEGRASPLSIETGIGGNSILFEGRAGTAPLGAEGELQIDAKDLPALGAVIGSPVSVPQRGFGAEKLSLSAKASLDDRGRISLRGAKITADDNLLVGDLDLVQGEARPKVSGNLRAESLHLTSLTGDDGKGADTAAPAPASGWSQEKIDVSALGKIDAALTLGAGAIDLGRIKLGESRLVLTIDRSRAVFTIHQMAAYDGSVTGEFVVNGRGGLSVGGDLTLAGIEAEQLTKDLADWDRLISQGNLAFKFLAVGNTMDALMKSLDGQGNLTLSKGELRGLDIGGMLRNLDTSYVGEGQKTIFDGISASFSIAKGNLTNSDLRLLAPYVNATGQGRIGIGARDFDYRIRPTAFPSQEGTGGVMVPLRITGPWAKPTYRLDLESVAREKMEAEAKEAEARAKAALEERLRSELGVEVQEGERLEDAAKRRAREALEKEAGRLLQDFLGGN